MSPSHQQDDRPISWFRIFVTTRLSTLEHRILDSLSKMPEAWIIGQRSS